MCEHLLGPISPTTRRRTCRLCNQTVPAEGTYQVQQLSGSLERYPSGLFSQWEHGQIRRFLNVNKRVGDLLLHNWADNYLYVYRAARDSTPLVEEEIQEDSNE